MAAALAGVGVFAVTALATTTADFTFDPTSPTPNQSVGFDASSSSSDSDTIATYDWDWGDGTTETGDTTPTTSHSFDDLACHDCQVKLTLRNASSDIIGTKTETVTVNAPPTAAFSVPGGRPNPGVDVTFHGGGTGNSSDSDGTIAHYQWQVDGSDAGTDSSDLTTSFATPGDHTVSLKVTDNDGADSTNTASHTITINAPPTADFSVPSGRPNLGNNVTFHGGSGHSSDSDGTIAHYHWQVDGSDAGTDSPDLTTSFTPAGDHTVSLKVTDNDGADSTVTTKHISINHPPTAAFTSSPAHPITEQAVGFDAGGSTDAEDGTNLHYQWDFDGDGYNNDPDEVDTPTPSHTFSNAGPKSVSLRVTDQDGGSAIDTHNVVIDGPVADFTWTPTSPVTGQTVTFNNASIESGSGFLGNPSWDLNNDGSFGDGPGEGDLSPSRTFPAPGNYTIKLRVTDSNGVTGTVTHVVTVDNTPPAASFTWAPANPLPGDVVTFSSTSSDPDGPIAGTAWDLNANNIFGEPGETGMVVSRSFPAPGTYPVTLHVTDQSGATATAFNSVTVLAPPSVPVKPRAVQPIDPFPIVTIRGKVTRTGVKITSLVVQTPVGTTVTIRCTGRHCPFKSTASIAKVRKLKVKKLQRSLRGDMVLQLYVTHPGEIGKYTRFHIRTKGKGPVRQDKCLAADTNAIQRCPS